MKRHRATLILVMGILGLVVCAICSPIAWMMANADLAEMDAGMMDPSGRENTNIGRILGMVGTGLMAVGLLVLMLYMFILGAALSSQ